MTHTHKWFQSINSPCNKPVLTRSKPLYLPSFIYIFIHIGVTALSVRSVPWKILSTTFFLPRHSFQWPSGMGQNRKTSRRSHNLNPFIRSPREKTVMPVGEEWSWWKYFKCQRKDVLELSWLSLAQIKLAYFIIPNFLYFLWTLQGLNNYFLFLLHSSSLLLFLYFCA